MKVFTIALCTFLLSVMAGGASYGDVDIGKAPVVGASSEFQFGFHKKQLTAIQSAKISDLRDGTIWSQIDDESTGHEGALQRSAVGELLQNTALVGSVIVFPQHPDFEGGVTVQTTQGIHAFAEHVASVASAFPKLPAIEVGNEFNTQSFVKGPVKALSPLQRADLYAKYLAEIAKQPAVQGRRILGAATHSIAAGYIWRLLDQGAAAHMDAVTIHPYTSQAEQLPRQIEILRRHPDMAGLDIEMTEFGTTDFADAPDKFWRMYCTMAMSGVSRAVWYPLRARGDGYAPLFREDMRMTSVGRAYLAAQTVASERDVQLYRPDPFTWGCVFDGKLAVLWGAPRTVSLLRGDLEVLWADTRVRSSLPELEEKRVLVLKSSGRDLDLDRDLELGPLNLVADSYHQFDFPPEGSVAHDGDAQGFDRFFRVGQDQVEFITCAGQQERNVPWFPYLCAQDGKGGLLHGRGFVLGARHRQPMALVHQYNVNDHHALEAEVGVNMKGQGSDGVGVSLEHNGQVIDRQIATGNTVLKFTVVPTVPGDTVSVVLDKNDTMTGDMGQLRIRLRDAGSDVLKPAQ
ncbi:MAG: hypothetical protein ABJJ53_00910 [Sulfitobacter sp.]